MFYTLPVSTADIGLDEAAKLDKIFETGGFKENNFKKNEKNDTKNNPNRQVMALDCALAVIRPHSRLLPFRS